MDYRIGVNRRHRRAFRRYMSAGAFDLRLAIKSAGYLMQSIQRRNRWLAASPLRFFNYEPGGQLRDVVQRYRLFEKMLWDWEKAAPAGVA